MELGCSFGSVQMALHRNSIPVRPPVNKVNMTGEKHGALLVTGMRYKKGEHSKCIALCDCGVVKEYSFYALKDGATRSCGCMKNKKGKLNKKWRGHGDISANRWRSYIHGAESRGIRFDITIEQGWALFLKQNKACALTGMDIWFPEFDGGGFTASLDRIFSNGIYTIDNVQWVHKSVNIMKMGMNPNDFLKFCSLVSNYSVGKVW